MIDRRVQNALALDYPRDRLELIVGSDGSTDATVERARAAGADLVLDLPRGGKIRAQDAAVERAARRDRRVLGRQRVLGARRAARPRRAVRATRSVGYVCGQVRFVDEAGTNMEGAVLALRDVRSARSSRASRA